MKDLIFLFYFIYLAGIFTFIFSKKHFLLMLISLEFMSLAMFFGMFLVFYINLFNLFYLMVFLSMAVCEGVLGLSVMVMMIRSSGGDNLSNFSLLW